MEILNQQKAEEFRRKYISLFVNTESEHYNQYIAKLRMFKDGLRYTGYLWDCFINPTLVSAAYCDNYLKRKGEIYIFWDIHSCERIPIPDYWKYPIDCLMCMTYDEYQEHKHVLPEDVYIFDETFSWTIAYTHEDIEGEQYCLFVETDSRYVII